MKLLYLYIEDYGCIKNQEFNFDSNYHFHLNKDNSKQWKLIEDKVENPLPDDFWRVNTEFLQVVDSVSVIVGENGSGKTSMARFIGHNIGNSIFSEQSKGSSYVFLIQKESKNGLIDNVYLFTNTDVKLITKENKEIKNTEYAITDIPPKFVYFSPFYTTEHHMNSIQSIDLSTSHCLAQGTGTRTEHYQNLANTLIISPTHAHEHYEYKISLKLIKKMGRSIEKFDIHTPRGVFISPEKELTEKITKNELIKIRDNFDGNNTDIDQDTNTQLRDLYKKVVALLNKVHTSDCFILSFVYYIASYCKDHVYSAYSTSRNLKKEPLKTEFEKVKKYIDYAQSLCKSLPPLQTYENMLERHHKDILEFINQSSSRLFPEEYAFFAYLEELYKKTNQTDNTPLESLSCSCEDAANFIDLYYKCFAITNFLSLTFNPHLSSGEMAYLTMFSRINEVLEKDEELGKGQPFILFLDEAETTIHPKLQRKLVTFLIAFLEEFAKERKVHLIFATHSPVLLSDIPDSNVVFLEKDKDTGCTHVVDHGKTDKTFGANIYSLYKNSFFMKEGLMGEFAMDKIKKVFSKFDQAIELSDELDVLNKARDRKKNAKRIEEIKQELENIKKEETEIMSIISMVGEPLIQEQLLRYARGVFTKETREKDLREYYIDQLKKLGTEVIIK